MTSRDDPRMGRVVHRIVGETIIIKVSKFLSPDAPPQLVSRASQEVYDQVWNSIKEHFVEATGAEMAVEIFPVTVDRDYLMVEGKAESGAILIECKAFVAPLHGEMYTGPMRWNRE